MSLLTLIPLLPLLSAVLLIITAGRMPKILVTVLGAGSVGLSAVCVAVVASNFLADGQVLQLTLWIWMSVANFTPGIAFYVDGLTIVMMSVITGVGFLIHLYSLEFMGRRVFLPLFRLYESVCGRHAAAGHGGQPAAALPGLGRRGRVLVSARWLLVPGSQ